MDQQDPDTIRPPSNGERVVSERTVLIADDEAALARGIARWLKKAGIDSVLVHDGNDAVQAIMARSFSAILSDIHMPGTSGVELLRVVRAYDLDVPVILMTGGPAVETAVDALGLGALEYLCKPFAMEDVVRVVERAALACDAGRQKRQASRSQELFAVRDAEDRNSAFDRALGSLSIVLQPIVSVRGQRIVGHEVLMRTGEPSFAGPMAVLTAAEERGRLAEVGRAVRGLAADALRQDPDLPLLFVNLHAEDLLDPELADADSPLGRYAERVVLEIAERDSLDQIPEIGARVSILRYLGYRFALDDLGAGHGDIGSFARCEPEFVKLDMSLVRDIHLSKSRQKLARGLFSLSSEFRATMIAEGVESSAERDVMMDLGCDLMQGYFFAKPAAKPPTVTFRSR